MSPPASRIAILPPQLADQIAAGEVVERPASVVKELVENALDAGARRIEIEIAGGGRALVRVTDDGSGMTPDEARLALRRHATSKLRAIDDLLDLRTMGFRGEALPSIAAVSRLALTTRPADSIEGFRLAVEGGLEIDARAAGAPPGTQVEVRDLFWNVPARLKFLKADPTETAHVIDAVLRLGLAHPSVHLRLRGPESEGGRTLVDLPPHKTPLERARAALSRRAPVQLHLAEGEEQGVRVLACLGAPTEAQATTRNTHLFVNRRFVRDRGLLQSLVLGYGELLDRGRYPLAVVHVELPPGAVDVNVHPQKIEVRFARPDLAYAAVRHVVRAACAKAPWLAAPPAGESAMRVYRLPPEPPAPREPASPPPDRSGSGWTARERPASAWDADRMEEALALFAPRPALAPAAPANGEAPVPVENGALTKNPIHASRMDEPRGFFASLRYLGQLHRTYLVCEAPGELVLIDQHAAHERVAFERLRGAFGGRGPRVQRLLFPRTIDLDDARAAAAVEHAAVLSRLGFEIEPFGGRSFVVKAVPEVLTEGAHEELDRALDDVLDELAARGASDVVTERFDHLLATMACHSVVRAGDVLDEARVRALLDSMDGVDFRAHCPHGRPVLLRMSVGEMERRFGRT